MNDTIPKLLDDMKRASAAAQNAPTMGGFIKAITDYQNALDVLDKTIWTFIDDSHEAELVNSEMAVPKVLAEQELDELQIRYNKTLEIWQGIPHEEQLEARELLFASDGIQECEWYGKNLGKHDYINILGGKRCIKCKHEIIDKKAILIIATFEEMLRKWPYSRVPIATGHHAEGIKVGVGWCTSQLQETLLKIKELYK